MNNKGKGNVRSYIAVVIILVSALIFMFYLLNSEKERLNAKPMTEGTTKTNEVINNENEDITTTTTIAIDNNEGVITPINIEPVSNFSSSLDEIIGDLGFFGDYNVTTFYHGVELTFKCTNYTEESGVCSAGSALMKVNDALYPLYTYDNSLDNYLLRGEDYYIVLNDDMVMLYTTHSGVSAGSARIFDLRGIQVGTLNSTLLGYKLGDNYHSRLYPNFEDGRIYYYSCDNNLVSVKYAEINNYANTQVLESVEGTCY